MKNHVKSYENLEWILVIFDAFLHIVAYFDNGISIFRPISSFWQILGPKSSMFNHFMAMLAVRIADLSVRIADVYIMFISF